MSMYKPTDALKLAWDDETEKPAGKASAGLQSTNPLTELLSHNVAGDNTPFIPGRRYYDPNKESKKEPRVSGKRIGPILSNAPSNEKAAYPSRKPSELKQQALKISPFMPEKPVRTTLYKKNQSSIFSQSPDENIEVENASGKKKYTLQEQEIYFSSQVMDPKVQPLPKKTPTRSYARENKSSSIFTSQQ